MKKRFVPAIDPLSGTGERGSWFIFRKHKLMIMESGAGVEVPFISSPGELGVKTRPERYMGTLDGRPCYYAEAEDDRCPEGAAYRGLRYLYGRLEESDHKLAMRAIHLVEWEKNEQYCGRCGGEKTMKQGVNARECRRCGHVTFPRISPAVIVLVERDGMALLARATRFTENMYSVLAGFVEPGETLEETVAREIEEEVGITVRNVRYFGSQPWPFPDSLMIGFTAEYAGGEIRVDDSEIETAAWFRPEGMPAIPGRISIARQLIDWFLEKEQGEEGGEGSAPAMRYRPDE